MYEKLRDERKKRKITCEEMSKVLGQNNRQFYSRKEQGLIRFTLAEAKQIADFFEMTIEELFYPEEVTQ